MRRRIGMRRKEGEDNEEEEEEEKEEAIRYDLRRCSGLCVGVAPWSWNVMSLGWKCKFS